MDFGSIMDTIMGLIETLGIGDIIDVIKDLIGGIMG